MPQVSPRPRPQPQSEPATAAPRPGRPQRARRGLSNREAQDVLVLGALVRQTFDDEDGSRRFVGRVIAFDTGADSGMEYWRVMYEDQTTHTFNLSDRSRMNALRRSVVASTQLSAREEQAAECIEMPTTSKPKHDELIGQRIRVRYENDRSDGLQTNHAVSWYLGLVNRCVIPTDSYLITWEAGGGRSWVEQLEQHEYEMAIPPTCTPQIGSGAEVSPTAASAAAPSTGLQSPVIPRLRKRHAGKHKGHQQSTIACHTESSDSDDDGLDWVQCDACDNWHALPAEVSTADLPERFECTMNWWSADTKCAEKAAGLKRQHDVIDIDCSICHVSFGSLPPGTTVRRLARCGHCFCEECITQWFGTGQRTCPNCRVFYSGLRHSSAMDVAQVLLEANAAPAAAARPAKRSRRTEHAGTDPSPCKVCGSDEQPEELACCHECNDNYHFKCLPPSDNMGAQGNWYCNAEVCQIAQRSKHWYDKTRTNKRKSGLSLKRWSRVRILQQFCLGKGLWAGAGVPEMCERLARSDLGLPKSVLEQAHEVFVQGARVEMIFAQVSGRRWYVGTVEYVGVNHMDIRFDDGELEEDVPLLQAAEGSQPQVITREVRLAPTLPDVMNGAAAASMSAAAAQQHAAQDETDDNNDDGDGGDEPAAATKFIQRNLRDETGQDGVEQARVALQPIVDVLVKQGLKTTDILAAAGAVCAEVDRRPS